MLSRRRGMFQVRAVAAVLVAFCPSPSAAQDLTTEDIVVRAARAMGGSPRLEGLRTLQFEFQTPKGPLKWEIVRPDLVRKEREGDLVLLFDGKRAGFLEGPAQGDGTLAGPHLVPEEDWHHFEIDIALYIPAFFDFPAEYEGQRDVDGHPAHVLRVTLPMGGVVVYYIDAGSWLPIGVDVPDWGLEQRYGDFRAIGGIVYPHRFWFGGNSRDFLVLEGLEVNGDVDAGRFVFPDGIR